MAKKKDQPKGDNLMIDGNEIYIVVEDLEDYKFREALLPGCVMTQIKPYVLIADGKKHIVIQFERKK